MAPQLWSCCELLLYAWLCAAVRFFSVVMIATMPATPTMMPITVRSERRRRLLRSRKTLRKVIGMSDGGCGPPGEAGKQAAARQNQHPAQPQHGPPPARSGIEKIGALDLPALLEVPVGGQMEAVGLIGRFLGNAHLRVFHGVGILTGVIDP